MRKSIWPLVAVILIAAAFRILYLYQFSQLPAWSHLTVDNNYHLNWAQNIADGNVLGDTTYFRAPLYVFFLAVIMKFFGVSLWAFRVFGLLVGLATTYVIYLMALRLSGRRAALTAAFLWAVYPMTVYFEAELLLDSLFTLLLVSSFYTTLVASAKKAGSTLFLAGILWGLAAITRPTALVVLPIAIWILYREQRPNLGSSVKRTLLLLAGTALIVLAIFSRNLYVANDAVLIASQGGVNLYIGNNHLADGVTARLEEPLGQNWRISDISYLAEKEVGRELKPGEVSDYWTSKALSWMVAHPSQALTLYGKKLTYFFANREVSNNRDLDRHFRQFDYLWYNPLTFGLLFVLAGCGLILGTKTNRRLSYPGGLILLYSLAVSLFFISSRFRLPVAPFLTILASVMVTFKLSDIGKRFLLLLVTAAAAGAVTFVAIVKFPPGTPVMEIISRGLHEYQMQNYEKALELFEQGRRIDSTFPEINLNCGAAHLRLGQADSATYYFTQETIHNPLRHAAYTNLASVELLGGRYKSSLTMIRQALALSPYDINSNLLFVRLLGADSTLIEGSLSSQFDLATKRTHNDLEVLLESAAVALKQNRFDIAEPILRRALRSSAPPIETDAYAFDRDFRNSRANRNFLLARVHYQLGYCLANSGRFAEAVLESRDAIYLDSSLIEAYVNLIGGFIVLNRRAEADSVLGEALLRFGNDPIFDRFGDR